MTLELDPAAAAVARRNLDRAGVGDRVEIRVGPAADSLAAMVAEAVEPFDFVFLDADKVGYPAYLEGALALSHPGTVIVADNVVRGGAVADPETNDANALGVRRFLEMAGSHPRLDATAVQTVGTKGHDGFALVLVTD